MRPTVVAFAGLSLLTMCIGAPVVPQDTSSGRAQAPPGEAKPPQDTAPKDASQPQAKTAEATASATAPRAEREMELRLSLEDVVRMGIENNLSIKLSSLDDKLRQRELIIAKAVFDPFFNLGTSYSRNRDPTVSFFDLGSGVTQAGVSVNPSKATSYSTGLSGTYILGTQYTLTLAQVQRDRPLASKGGIVSLNPVTSTEVSASLRQPLLKGAWYTVNSADIRIAQNNSVLSREQLELTLIDTVFLIEETYWNVFFANQNLDSKTKALQVATENLENVTKKKNVGTLAQIDVTTAESQVALRKVDREEAALLFENTRDQLLNLINYTKDSSLKVQWESGSKIGPYDNVMVVCTSEPSMELPDVDRDRALGAAFTRRPEYHQLELNVQNQEIRIEVAKNGLLPSLDLTAKWSQLGLESAFDESFSELSSGRFYDWQAGIELSVPLSNRGPSSRYRNARDELRKLKLQKVDLENQIVLQVDQAIRRIDSLRRKVRDLDERVRLQEELLRAERLKLDVGKSIAYTVSVIENDLVENQTQALRAKADFQAAKSELYRAMGTLLERHRIEVEAR